MALANITNNILTDSGILVTNLTPTTRTLTINGVTYDLSADRSWTIATHDAVTIGTANGLSLSGQVLSLGLASGSANGALSSTDWNTFNNKQNALTNPVTGTGTTNYLPKFTGASTIGNSLVFDNGTNVGIGTATPYSATNYKFLTIDGTNGSGYVTRVGSVNSFLAYSNSAGTTLSEQRALPIVFETTGTSRMTLNASGNLGLGVTPSDTLSYGRALDIQGTAGSALYVRSETNSSTVYGLFSYDNNTVRTNIGGIGTGNYLRFISGGSEAMRLNASGNLSIGNTNDTYKLDVSGTGRFTGTITASSGVYAGDSKFFNSVQLTDSLGGTCQGFLWTDAANTLKIGTGTVAGGNVKLTIASTGAATFSSSVQVGSASTSTGGLLVIGGSSIGTASSASGQILIGLTPSYRGSIAYDDNAGYLYIDNTYNNNSGNIYFRTKTGGTAINALTIAGTGAATFSSSVTTGGDVNIPNGNYYYAKRNTGGANINILGIASGTDTTTLKGGTSGSGVSIQFEDTGGVIAGFNNGRLGIGTTGPQQILHLQGSGTTYLHIGNSSTGSGGSDGFDIGYFTGETALNIVQRENDAMLFSTNNTERMRITSVGSVGIGTSSPIAKLHIENGNIFMNNSASPYAAGIYNSNSIYLADNQYLDFSTGTFKATSTGTSNRLQITYSEGFVFYTSPSVSGGSNVTSNERMRITTAGNVGIGTTSPSAKLDIVGTARISDNLYWAAGDGVNWYIQGQANGPTIRMKYDGGSPNRSGALGWVDNGGNRYEALTWQDTTAWFSGNVGIGTTSPVAALDVSGNATLVANFNYASSGTYVRWQNNGTSFGDVGSAGQLVSGGSTNDFAIHARSTYNMVFATNFTERMRITSAGEACIGRTTAYGAGFLLNVQGNIYASAGIVTGAPSGESSATWKLGNTRTGTCVPGSWGDFSSWFTGTVANIEINGTTYTIPVVNAGYC